MASKITPQSGLLEIDGRLKVKDAIYANEVLTKGAVGKTLERQIYAAEGIDTTSGTIPIVVAVNTADAYDSVGDVAKVKIFDDATNDKIIGVVIVTTLINATGFAVSYGSITSNLNTSASTVNAAVYADPANGQLTLTNTGKQIGTVLTLHASAGEILINVAGEAGAGSGGDTNFIADSNPESGQAVNFATYDDGASTTPLNGTGGSASTLTFAAYTASPLLRTLGDWKLTKSAADGQGEGLSYDFAIEPAFKNQVLECSFNYNTSANYVSNDMGMYIYDVTNSVIIYPNVINIPQTSNTNAKMYFKFFATSGVDYRVIFHVQTTSALAYTFSFTDFSVRPETKVIGAAISDWFSYTPTINGAGTPTNVSFNWRRVGADIEIFGSFTAGTVTAAAGYFNLPTGLSLDLTKVVHKVTKLGTGQDFRISGTPVSVTTNVIDYFYDSGLGATNIRIGFQTATSVYVLDNINVSIGTGDNVSVVIKAPIANWSSNINLIQSQTEFAYNTDTAVAVNDTTSFGYGAEGVNFVAISSADVFISKRVRFKQPIQITDKIEIEVNAGNGWQLLPYVDTLTSSYISALQLDPAGNGRWGMGLKIINSTDVDVVFGGNGRVYANAVQEPWSEVTSFKWRVRKSAGSAVGEVMPFVGAKYNSPIAATVDTSNPFQFNNKVYDTHNAVTTGSSWKFTAPVSGYYTIKTVGLYAGGSTFTVMYYKNGSSYEYGGSSTTSIRQASSVEIPLNQGDYIDIRTSSSITSEATLTLASVTITKIG